MKVAKDECVNDYKEKKLNLSDEKCNPCPYLYLCPYMAMALDEIVNGD